MNTMQSLAISPLIFFFLSYNVYLYMYTDIVNGIGVTPLEF